MFTLTLTNPNQPTHPPYLTLTLPCPHDLTQPQQNKLENFLTCILSHHQVFLPAIIQLIECAAGSNPPDICD